MLVKARVFACLCFYLCFSVDLEAQEITIKVVDTELPEVLILIENQNEQRFAFNNSLVPEGTLISYEGSGTVDEVLTAILDPLGLDFEFLEKQIIIKRKSAGPPGKGTLKGYIKDELNGEALIGASVYFQELGIGTVTNPFGFFSIPVPNGTYELTISFIGYDEIKRTIEISGSTNFSILMAERPPVLEEVIVTSYQSRSIEEIQMSKDQIRPKTVEDMPALFGETDVIKSLEFMPGIKSHSDGSTFFYVRGGNRDQNLILIDDAPIFNSSHLLGIFSTVIPDAINSIEIYKGNMPANLGGRLSSIIDIRTKKGNDQRMEVWGNAGLISTKLGVEGPIKKGQSSFLISGRASRIKWLFDESIEDLKRLNFYDFTGKLNFKTSSRDNIYISTYAGEDNYFVDNFGIEWSNLAGSIRWNRILKDNLFMNTTLAGSSYEYFLTTDVTTNTRWKSRIATISLKGDFTYFPKANSTIDFGAELNGYNFNPGNLSTDDPNVIPPLVSVKNSLELVLYGSHNMRINEHFGIEYGLRLSSWTNQGAAFEFEYNENFNVTDTLFFDEGEDYAEFGNIEPRLGLSYFIDDHSALKFSYSRNVQNVHLISNSISPFTSLEVWLPSGINIQPQIANQVAIGYSQLFENSGLLFSVEGYYKHMQNQIDYEPHAETLLNPLLEGELRFGEGRSYGLEFLLKKEQGRFRGWAGYTASRAKRQFSDLNAGESFNAFYDRPHEVNMVLTYDLTDRITLGTNWTYYTGSPFSSPTGFFQYNGLEAPIYDQKNNDRLPDYHRLDASATFRLNKNLDNRFTHDLSFSIFNLYGRKNSLFINYNKTETETGDFVISSNLVDTERTASQYYLFQFTPSVTYNFRFL